MKVAAGFVALLSLLSVSFDGAHVKIPPFSAHLFTRPLVLVPKPGLAVSINAFDTAAADDDLFNKNIDWQLKLSELDSLVAKGSDKPTMLLISKQWCGACKQLKSSFNKGNGEAKEIEGLAKHFNMVLNKQRNTQILSSCSDGVTARSLHTRHKTSQSRGLEQFPMQTIPQTLKLAAYVRMYVLTCLQNYVTWVNLRDGEEPHGSEYTPDGGYIPRILFLSKDGKIQNSIVRHPLIGHTWIILVSRNACT
eukprot:3200480-Pyramimonas_sp.AAC.1